jgi:HK97 family phage major capsid protein
LKLFELKRDRAEKLEAARKIVTTAIDASRALTAEETTQVDGLRSEAEALSRKIELFELRDSFGAADGGTGAGTGTRSDGGRLGPGTGNGAGLPELDGTLPYSLLRALRMQLNVREGVAGAKFDGLEAEVHAELARSKPAGSEVRGILVPWHLATHRSQSGGSERRDVTTSTASGGIANLLGTPMIEFLRNRMVMQAMGASVLTGLEGGTFSLPKQTAAETAYHVAEGVSPTASNLTLGQVTWTPRTLAAQSAITRKTILQTSLDIEMRVRGSIIQQLAREFDRVGVNGSGTGTVPMGIMQDPNVPISAIGTNGGAPTWAMLVDLESKVAQANADFGKLGYITSNKGRAKFKTTTKIVSSQYSDFLWQKGNTPGEGEVNSYRAMSTEQVPSNLAKGSGTSLTAVVFGNFDSATYGLWSGVDVLLDPYTAGSSGALKLYAFQDYDFQMVYEVGFAKCVDVDPS